MVSYPRLRHPDLLAETQLPPQRMEGSGLGGRTAPQRGSSLWLKSETGSKEPWTMAVPTGQDLSLSSRHRPVWLCLRVHTGNEVAARPVPEHCVTSGRAGENCGSLGQERCTWGHLELREQGEQPHKGSWEQQAAQQPWGVGVRPGRGQGCARPPRPCGAGQSGCRWRALTCSPAWAWGCTPGTRLL